MGLQFNRTTADPESPASHAPAPEVIEPAAKHQPVASRLHLLLFLLIQVVVVLRSGRTLPFLISIKDQPSLHFWLPCVYLTVIAFEFAQVLFVWYGIRKTGTTISDLIGGRWSSFWDVLKDLFFAGGLWLVWMIAAIVLAIAIRPQSHGVPDHYIMAPTTSLEITLWLVLSSAAGFCEEIVYRGYLQRQFLARCQNPALAILFQSVVFASIHRYEGPFAMLVIGTMAILFGSFAARRKSLRAGIIAHIWHDAFVGVLFFLASRYR